MMRLRSGLIGSMSAWLPSRRSTAHQRGASVMRFDGHVRSGSSTRICSWNGRYLCTGMADGFWVFFMVLQLLANRIQPMTNSATREAWD
jgi:prepilin-type processing-associated H-X9-DG protein